jgi:hypothetical protein
MRTGVRRTSAKLSTAATTSLVAALAAAALVLGPIVPAAHAHLYLEATQLVEAGGVDIAVPAYSVPSTADWNSDGLQDLIVGEGTTAAKVRVYLNEGTAEAPSFSEFSYVQSMGADLVITGGG